MAQRPLQESPGTLPDPSGELPGRSWTALGCSWLGFACFCTLKSPNFKLLDNFSSEFCGFAPENTPKAFANMPKTCESTPKTCQQRCASDVGFQQGCGGRAKRTQSAAPCVYAGSEAFIDSSSYSRTPSELGELASPYPSSGLRETADPPDVENYFAIR